MQTLKILLMLVLAAQPQRIETQYPDRSKVTRLGTAMNHLTIIELAEPVTMAAAGSPLFKIERRENKVFIQPLEEGASTNLFVWTGSGRWNFELVPAGSVETMHFAIDQPNPPAPKSDAAPPKTNPDSGTYPSLAEEMLLFAKPIRSIDRKSDRTAVGIVVTEVYRKNDLLFIRYVVDNRSTRPYVIGQPEVFALESPHSETSLQVLRDSQVGPDIEKKIRSPRQTRLATGDCDTPSEPLPPGEAATGILTVQLAMTSMEPTVLRLLFLSDGREPISLTLVL
jgi:hypothetical protein